ncbi:MAG: DUF2786 domain-containing protein [Phenylobacterium sp.]|uniref:DUF7168 domain-containing protein n=1 Tax=Phenylobacterium sp. TaxID=1871053 RepID=UPI002732AC57|nr:DUF2786 domain-containing protein [Phenylobacterium sp.]MDP1642753.1 DUF2786 domain-containing protein [Phenylobacterium sp.]MDP3117199.1 DUF2786 domain-containing protein [Phenylobacterium sp.]
MERQKIAARIRALLAKTVANGCTEAEAVAAAELAAKLLAQYELTLDDLELRSTPFAQTMGQDVDDLGPQVWKVAAAIADLVGVRYWTTGAGVRPVQVTFFGFTHEVEIATYLLEICQHAMRGQLTRLQRDVALLRRTVQAMRIRAFLDGMAERLAERIRALKPPPAPAGTGLVVLRGELIDKALHVAGIELESSTGRSSRNLDPEYQAGRLAADRVGLKPGLRAGPAHGQLNGRRP